MDSNEAAELVRKHLGEEAYRRLVGDAKINEAADRIVRDALKPLREKFEA